MKNLRHSAIQQKAIRMDQAQHWASAVKGWMQPSPTSGKPRATLRSDTQSVKEHRARLPEFTSHECPLPDDKGKPWTDAEGHQAQGQDRAGTQYIPIDSGFGVVLGIIKVGAKRYRSREEGLGLCLEGAESVAEDEDSKGLSKWLVMCLCNLLLAPTDSLWDPWYSYRPFCLENSTNSLLYPCFF